MEQVCVRSFSHLSVSLLEWCESLADAVSVFFFASAGAEEDSAGPDGPPTEPWLRAACGRLHSQVPGEAQHGYLPH